MAADHIHPIEPVEDFLGLGKENQESPTQSGPGDLRTRGGEGLLSR